MQAFITFFSDWFIHLDTHLASLVALHGDWIYIVLFSVIFIETGIVVMPFLPGDSLLFVSGALAANGLLDPVLLFFLLSIAAVLGDSTNYCVGSYVRKKSIDTQRIPMLKKEHLERTHKFFEKHGSKTIILARFVPVVRTIAPFVAALGAMPPRTFLTFNVIGAVTWVGFLIAAGSVFGTIPWISKNLTIVILGIVFLSILPALIAWASALIRDSKAPS